MVQIKLKYTYTAYIQVNNKSQIDHPLVTIIIINYIHIIGIQQIVDYNTFHRYINYSLLSKNDAIH